MRKATNQLWATLLLCCAITGLTSAQPTEIGSEISVYTTGSSTAPVVKYSSSQDEYIVVWENDNAGDHDIYGQRYASDGTPVGTATLLNSTTTGNQTSPDVAIDGSGNIIVTYTSDHSSDLDVYFRVFNNTWTQTVAETGITGNDLNSQLNSSVALLDGGDFVVVYANGTAAPRLIDFETFQSDGTSITSGNLATTVTNLFDYPQVAAETTTGNFAIVYGDETASKVFYDLFDNTGSSLVGGQQDLGTRTNGTGMDVDMRSNGSFAVTWVNSDVYAASLTSGGAVLASATQMSATSPATALGVVGISYFDANSLFVSWGSGTNTYVQEAEVLDLSLRGTEYQINNTAVTTSASVGLDKGPSDQLFAAWSDNGGGSVFGQVLCACPAAPSTTGNSGVRAPRYSLRHQGLLLEERISGMTLQQVVHSKVLDQCI